MPRTRHKKDYYKLLEISKDASQADIKKSYRRLARKYHPDRNKGSKKSEAQFKIVSEAYEVLGNKKKRKAYDQRPAHRTRQTRTNWDQPGGRYGYDYGTHQQEREYREPFSRTATEEPPPPDPDAPRGGFDLQFMVDVPFETVALGGTIPYSYKKYVNCPSCKGTGDNGDGTCADCDGKRWVVDSVTLNVAIPPGVADQYTLRIQHEGGEGMNGGPPGDLFLKVCTQPHPRFKRKKNDIFAEVPISAALAEKGGPLKVEILNSVKKTIQVEEATLTGEEYRIVGEGAAIMWGKKRGDFVVKFLVEEE
ncbi:MAG: DnaJ C-terminal domain-containing protein [Nitrospinaceae bacterium]